VEGQEKKEDIEEPRKLERIHFPVPGSVDSLEVGKGSDILRSCQGRRRCPRKHSGIVGYKK